jgi:hypothetical protein
MFLQDFDTVLVLLREAMLTGDHKDSAASGNLDHLARRRAREWGEALVLQVGHPADVGLARWFFMVGIDMLGEIVIVHDDGPIWFPCADPGEQDGEEHIELAKRLLENIGQLKHYADTDTIHSDGAARLWCLFGRVYEAPMPVENFPDFGRGDIGAGGRRRAGMFISARDTRAARADMNRSYGEREVLATIHHQRWITYIVQVVTDRRRELRTPVHIEYFHRELHQR